MKRYSFILLIAIQLFYTTGAQAQWNSPNRYKTPVFTDPYIVNLNNVVYSIVPDVLNQQIPQSLNIFFPNTAYDGVAKRPLIMIVHGGAFQGNIRTKEEYTPYAKALAKMGYVVACIDYRLYNNTPYTAYNNLYKAGGQTSHLPWYVAIQDLNAAIKFVCGNDVCRADPNNVFLFGESAGALTTLTLALAQPSDIIDVLTFPASIGDLNYSTLPKLKTLNYTIKGVAPIAGGLPFASFLDKTDQMPILMEANKFDGISGFEGFPSGMHFTDIINQLKSWNAVPGSYPCSYMYATWNGTFDAQYSSNPALYHCLNTNTGLPYFTQIMADFFAGILKNNPVCIHGNQNTANNFFLFSSLDQNPAPSFRTGLTEGDTPKLSVYPNPATENITINGLAEQSTVVITVYDGLGSLAKAYTVQTEAEEHNTSLSLEGLAAGMYYIRIKDALNDKQFKLLKE